MLVFMLRKRPGGGTQAANCEAPERMSPTFQVASTLIADNRDFIRVKTIPAGQNADFGGFLRVKAASTGRFSGSVPSHRECRRRSVPARSGAAQLALWAPPPTGHPPGRIHVL